MRRRTTVIPVLLLTAWLGCVSRAGVTAYGAIPWSDSRIYMHESGSTTLIGYSGIPWINAIESFGSNLYGVSNSGSLYQIDTVTGAGTPIVLRPNLGGAVGDDGGLAFTPQGTLYQVFGGQLYEIDVRTGDARAVGSVPGGIYAFAIDDQGKGVAGTLVEGYLYEIDLVTASSKGLGLLGFDNWESFDYGIDGVLYGIRTGVWHDTPEGPIYHYWERQLCAIDVQSLHVTPLYQVEFDELATTTIPAPGAAFLGAVGAGLVGRLRRRRTL